MASFELTPLDVLPCKFIGHKSYGNGDINSYITSYINIAQKAELAASIRGTDRFSKSGIPIFNSEVPDKTGRKATRRAKVIVKRYVFYANAARSDDITT